jgi:hypothetical protein
MLCFSSKAFLVASLSCLALSCNDEAGPLPDAAPQDALLVDVVSGENAVDDLGSDAGTQDADTPDALQGCAETLIPAPCQTGYDSQLEALATDYERSFHALSAATMDVWTDISVPDTASRTLVESFLQPGGGWDFQAATGQPVTSVVTAWHKTAGLYGGVGIAADAYRYGVLRDQGYPSAEVDRARGFLLAALDKLHMAVAITGTPGAIARGFLRTDMPANLPTTTPLFDPGGQPLPAEKNNGTWREDNSGGSYPDYIWEDSCSRDQYIGWVAGMGAAWEVIQSDASVPQLTKQRLQQDALALGQGLKTKRPSGFDLEIIDADGRTTYHGYLHENAFDRVYVPNPWVKNGVNAVMALGIVATLVYVSGDPALQTYLDQELIAKRELHKVIKGQLLVDAGPKSNYSGYNMAFMGAWLATRYLDPAAQAATVSDARAGLKNKLYSNPQGPTKPQPDGWKQSLFDLIYAAGMAQASAHGTTQGSVDATALANALDTLGSFPAPPFWSKTVENCDPGELSAFLCTAVDGTTTFVINPVNDRGDHPQSLTPVPFELRPPSNYDWRSNPFRVNGGSPGIMISGVDFRFAYWLGRWVRR